MTLFEPLAGDLDLVLTLFLLKITNCLPFRPLLSALFFLFLAIGGAISTLLLQRFTLSCTFFFCSESILSEFFMLHLAVFFCLKPILNL
jgi:hypothetical protein